MVGAALDNCQHEYEKDLNLRQELVEEMQLLHLLSCLIYTAKRRTCNVIIYITVSNKLDMECWTVIGEGNKWWGAFHKHILEQ